MPDPRHPLLWMAYVSLSCIHGGRRIRYFNAAPDTEMLASLARYVEEGVVRPHVDGVYELARIADAHRAFETSGSRGKQIIMLA
ncbi:zinc-binding dehydrogenase [Acidiphilium cryptum]|uniref:zinc-binding dehydrogenase n=1 Tax=Acidiphilium cryptum TaxID=524 RepID=UPI0018C8C8FD|nr:zinc-binding dehydrogenase [Acidiphilium cryptum]